MYYPSWSPYPQNTAPYTSRGRNTLEVTGEGVVTAAPDQAIIVLGVINENESLTAAQKENASAIASIIEALLQLSIPKEKIQTTQYSIDIQYNYDNGKQTFRGYKVTHLLQITTDQINLPGLIVDTAVQNGANTVSHIQFALANPEITYQHALSAAIKNSQFKAGTIAKTLGVTLHPIPFLVQETTKTKEPIPFAAASLSAKSEATTLQPGELEISAQIKASFTYS
jgi:uncharacterized protein